MNKKITLDNGKEYVIINEISYNDKIYCLTDRVINNQVQNDFNVFEKIKEIDESYSLMLIKDEKLKSEIMKNLKKY